MKCVGRQVEQTPNTILLSHFSPQGQGVWLERGSCIGACLKNTSVH